MIELSARSGASIPAHQPGAHAVARQLLYSLDDVTRAHEASVLRSDDGDALHDLRIDLRRARSVLHAFRDVLPPERVRPLRDGLRWLGGLTGALRDLDVVVERLEEERQALPPAESEVLEPLFVLLHGDRDAARRALVEGLRSERHRRLVLAWRRLTAKEPVRRETAPRDEAGADGPDGRGLGAVEASLREAAAIAVERVWRRLEQTGGERSESSAPEELHEVRILGKKLRYLLELLRPFYPEVDLDPAISRLRKLQDVLGELHDAWNEQQILRSLAVRAGAANGAPNADLLLGAGRLIERAATAGHRARARFPKRFGRVVRGAGRRSVAALLDVDAAPAAPS